MNATKEKLRIANAGGHYWLPNDGNPIIGVNEGEDKNETPYIVLRTIRYEHGLLAPVIIPRKFKTDLGSIPWLLKTIPGFRPTDPGKRAFIIHDFCYKKQLEDRRVVDAIMYSALLADGMANWQAFVCWLGVRLFGWKAWNENQRRQNRAKESSPKTGS